MAIYDYTRFQNTDGGRSNQEYVYFSQYFVGYTYNLKYSSFWESLKSNEPDVVTLVSLALSVFAKHRIKIVGIPYKTFLKHLESYSFWPIIHIVEQRETCSQLWFGLNIIFEVEKTSKLLDEDSPGVKVTFTTRGNRNVAFQQQCTVLIVQGLLEQNPFHRARHIFSGLMKSMNNDHKLGFHDVGHVDLFFIFCLFSSVLAFLSLLPKPIYVFVFIWAPPISLLSGTLLYEASQLDLDDYTDEDMFFEKIMVVLILNFYALLVLFVYCYLWYPFFVSLHRLFLLFINSLALLTRIIPMLSLLLDSMIKEKRFTLIAR